MLYFNRFIKRPPPCTRRAPTYEFRGEQLTSAEIAERTGLDCSTITRRLKTGVPLDVPDRRGTMIIHHRGFKGTIREWSEVTGLSVATIHSRLHRGWPIDRALTEPARAS
jgi:DNA-directed RNA polymerase specialized sigma24 family protein